MKRLYKAKGKDKLSQSVGVALGPYLLPVLFRCAAFEPLKELGEVRRVVGEVGGNVGNGAVGVAQQLPGHVHDAGLKIVARRVAGSKLNGVAEVRGMNV